ncbi:MAG: hypothetical protein HY078_11035 [Elusimicrobia bacterium]|nr:hypothetical protein [Elusimicrobiota bacterium]
MADKIEVEIFISPSGEVKWKVVSGPPQACAEVAKQISDSLGPIKEALHSHVHYQHRGSEEKRAQGHS